MADPIARSPITPAAPVTVEAGWAVTARRSKSELTITDCTPLAKVAVQAQPDGAMATALGVRHGRAARNNDGQLVAGSGPGQWLVLAPVGAADDVLDRLQRDAAQATEELATVIDLTHGTALIRITGEQTIDLLAKVCAVDLSDKVTPNGTAFRTSVARLVTGIVRDDRTIAGRTVRSYLLHCERSSGQYLFDTLLDAGSEYGIDIDGWKASGT